MTKPPQSIAQQSFAAIGKTFRGEIWENARRFKLVGKAYDALPREQGGYFDIRSAQHLKGPLRALRDPNVRTVFIIGATQVLKSVVGDIWIPYELEHNLRNILVLFETDPKALLYCDTRFMDTIKQHPVLSKWLMDVNRHDVGKTEIKMSGAKLVVGGLNDSNVSSLSWPVLWVSEAWQHFSDGLLVKAMKRTDRFPTSKKILIESQAGREGEDLHGQAKSAHQVPLTWACPHCGGRQSWDFSRQRPEDFTIAELRGKYSGMQFDKAENLSIDARARTAWWECYHKGCRIDDGPAIRQRIMDTYDQGYQIAGPGGTRISPSSVCFCLPKEAARDNSFVESARSYLVAKEAERAGNMVPLENWYMAERAIFYNPNLTQKRAQVIISSKEIQDIIPNEVARMFMVDCQQDPDLTREQGKSIIGHFWYTAWAIDANGRNIFQLARGYARSWQEWIKLRKALKIPNKNVAIDGGKWLHEVLDAAAANWEEGTNYTSRGKPFKAATVWTVMRGNGVRRSFKHADGILRVFAEPSFYTRFIEINGKSTAIQIPVIEWSNLSVKDQLFAIRQGGAGKPLLHILPREKLDAHTREKERDSCTYEAQISNEYRTRKNNKDVWLESNPNVHYNDCDCQGIVNCARGGLIGHIEAMEENVKEI